MTKQEKKNIVEETLRVVSKTHKMLENETNSDDLNNCGFDTDELDDVIGTLESVKYGLQNMIADNLFEDDELEDEEDN